MKKTLTAKHVQTVAQDPEHTVTKPNLQLLKSTGGISLNSATDTSWATVLAGFCQLDTNLNIYRKRES